MKNLLLIAVFSIIGMGLHAQDNVVKEEFYANGNLKAQFIALDNNLIEATYFFESGAINETGYFKNNQLTGKWTTFNINSELLAIGYFTNNEKSGTWNFYKNGEVIHEISYSEVQMAKN